MPGRWKLTGTYGECELCGALSVDTQVTSTNGRGEQSGQHGVVYVCNRQTGFPGFFLAWKEGESRVVNMVSCTYAIGRLDFPDFFLRGKKGSFWRIPVYSNTKLALTLFTLELAARVKERGIVVNAADPGIVSTDIITMHLWFDPLTDIFFRPFIRTPRQGAATAIGLLLDEEAGKRTGTLNVSGRAVRLSGKYLPHVQQRELWERTEEIVKKWL